MKGAVRDLEKHNRRQKMRDEQQMQQIRINEEAHRREVRESKLREWLVRKRTEQADRLEQLRQQQLVEVPAPVDSSAESTKNYEAWFAKKKKYEKAVREQKQRDIDLQAEYDRKRKSNAQAQYSKWLETAKDKPKPVPLSRGLFSKLFLFNFWKDEYVCHFCLLVRFERDHFKYLC